MNKAEEIVNKLGVALKNKGFRDIYVEIVEKELCKVLKEYDQENIGHKQQNTGKRQYRRKYRVCYTVMDEDGMASYKHENVHAGNGDTVKSIIKERYPGCKVKSVWWIKN